MECQGNAIHILLINIITIMMMMCGFLVLFWLASRRCLESDADCRLNDEDEKRSMPKSSSAGDLHQISSSEDNHSHDGSAFEDSSDLPRKHISKDSSDSASVLSGRISNHFGCSISFQDESATLERLCPLLSRVRFLASIGDIPASLLVLIPSLHSFLLDSIRHPLISLNHAAGRLLEFILQHVACRFSFLFFSLLISRNVPIPVFLFPTASLSLSLS